MSVIATKQRFKDTDAPARPPQGLESIPSYFYFIKHAFEGTLSVPVCRQTVDFLIAADGQQAVDIVGQMVVSALKAAS